MDKKSEDITEEWNQRLKLTHATRMEMNVLVMNYLEKEGFKEAAEKFRIESGIQPSVDLNTLDIRIQIRELIQNGQVEEAIAVINEIYPELLDSDNNLYFHLQQQQLIELIRAKEIEKALDFAQNHLAERAEEGDNVLRDLERTLALLAYDDPLQSPFKDLLMPSQKQKVASDVNARLLEIENQESVPNLAKILKLLTWSQNQLDVKKIKYVKMTDFGTGTLQPMP